MAARALALALAVCAIGAPAGAAPAPINPDLMTVSGRFQLPRAEASAYAGRVKLGEVVLDAGLARDAKLDPVALKTAIEAAAERSLGNFGYLASDEAADIVTLNLRVAPVAVAPTDAGAELTVTLDGLSDDACLARRATGRFHALRRERSGGPRRAFAVGASVAMGLALGPGVNTFMPAELATASAENRRRNAQREVGADEGVAPAFGEANLLAFGAMSAMRLALANYIGQLGGAPACRGPA